MSEPENAKPPKNAKPSKTAVKPGNVTERLLDLVMTLWNTKVPLSKQELRAKVNGYPQGESDTENFQRMFERDKQTLRQQGLDIQIHPIPLTDPPQEGYIIDEGRFYLPDLGLTAEELVALHLAQSAVSFSDDSTASAFRKLGGKPTRKQLGAGIGAGAGAGSAASPGAGSNSPAGGLRADVPNPSALLTLLQSKAKGQLAEFAYDGHRRRMLVWRLDYSRGSWYVTGHDFLRESERTFALHRIDGEVSVRSASRHQSRFREPPPEFNVAQMAIRSKPWEIAHQPICEAQLLVEASHAEIAELKLGRAAAQRKNPDGSTVFAVRVGHPQEFYRLVLFFLESAEILSPAALRRGFVRHLEELKAGLCAS